jgi:hypothetical protein
MCRLESWTTHNLSPWQSFVTVQFLGPPAEPQPIPWQSTPGPGRAGAARSGPAAAAAPDAADTLEPGTGNGVALGRVPSPESGWPESGSDCHGWHGSAARASRPGCYKFANLEFRVLQNRRVAPAVSRRRAADRSADSVARPGLSAIRPSGRPSWRPTLRLSSLPGCHRVSGPRRRSQPDGKDSDPA